MLTTATIDRFEGEYAVLKINGDTVNWPKKQLPEGAKESSIINVFISNNVPATADQKGLAKAILNEILDTKN
jgi:hypothetical protein